MVIYAADALSAHRQGRAFDCLQDASDQIECLDGVLWLALTDRPSRQIS
jgi:hypothetical protein